MENPPVEEIRISDLEGHELIGEGGCGAVFRVRDRGGRVLALKLLDEAAVNAGLLEKTTALLKDGGWPDGVMPVIAADFHASPPFIVSELAVDSTDGRPRNLQNLLDDHPGLDTWKTVKGIARALAAMHARHVPHGNLKPGNVFLNEDGSPTLRDWALGHMPGVRRADFTDALLYQPPERLRDAARYLDDGYRCDVFAFGVLAFRLLTGLFPRCHATFSQVAPPVGETRREGIRADLRKIAANLEAHGDVTWPEEAANPIEQQMRGWISKCLDLDPAKRPRDMGVVAAGLMEAEVPQAAEPERDALLDQRRHAGQQARRAWFATGAVAAAAIVFAALWHLRGVEMMNLKSNHASQSATIKRESAAAVETAESKAAEAEQALAAEREMWFARLKAAGQTSDRLFTWAMERGHRSIPPLDGRDLRLKQLERYFEQFIERNGDMPDLIEELAQARLQLAEISLSLGDATTAATRLDEALRVWDGQPMSSALRMRIATDHLLLAMLRQSQGDPAAGATFTKAREAFAAVPRADVDADRLDQLQALLDLHEAKLHSARGDDTKALENLMRASQTLNRVAEQRPDSAILRSALAASQLATADILDGLGSPDDAREMRQLAAGDLLKLLEKKPDQPELQSQLAACHAAMAEAAMLAGDAQAADSQSQQALKMLDSIIAAQPADRAAAALKANMLGLRAGLMQDRGNAPEALRFLDDGIRILEGIRASSPGDAMAAYRLALLWWQKGRTHGLSGNRDEGIALLGQARDLFGSLPAGQATDGPRPEQLKRSAAYLAGDLGHALQLANRKGDAARAFDAAVSNWETLAKEHPETPEYQDGLEWSRLRRDELK